MKDNGYTGQLRLLREDFGFDFVGLALVLAARQPLLTWAYAVGNRNTRYRRIVLESGKGVAGGVYKTGRAMVMQNVQKELSDQQRVEHPITIAEELMSMAAFPLWRDNTVQGVLLTAFRTPNRITPELFGELMERLTPSFCGFAVHEADYGQALGEEMRGISGKVESVPVYELLNHHILQAQEEERKRIARELHDSALQELIGVQMLLRTIKYQEGRQEMLSLIQEADARLCQIQSALRSLSTSLRPASLDDLGLTAAFRGHFRWVRDTYGQQVRFQENVGTARFPSEAETVFYRVCQEAVFNACKYAGCEEIEISLIWAEGYLTLEVTDHGGGFDLEKLEIKGAGMGLQGMAERAELIGGELTFQSAPGRGTSVWLTAPAVKEDCP